MDSPRTPRKAARSIVLSAGIIPVYLGKSEGVQVPRYLLLRVYSYWDFPKGIVFKKEDPLQAAIRELGEETTLKHPDFRWGLDYRETEPYSRGKIARYYLASVPSCEVSLPINPYLGIPEHHEFRWCGYAEARSLLAPRARPILDWAQDLVTGGIRKAS